MSRIIRCQRCVYAVLLLSFTQLAVFPTFADIKGINEAYGAMNAGFAFSDDAAAKLEANKSAAGDLRAHIALLAYYSVSCRSLPLDAIKRQRAEHISWIIRRAPTSDLFGIANAITDTFLSGDRLADPQRFHQEAALWREQVQAHPQDRAIRLNAANFLQLGDPVAAADLYRDLADSRSLGILYSLALLGVVARDYRSSDSIAVDNAVRNSEFSAHALKDLRQTSDAKMLARAGFWMAVQGGMLYANGKMDWDYTSLSHELLQRALALDPTTVDLYALVDQPLPKRGQPPPRVYGTSAADLRSIRIKGVAPLYPPDAKAKGIEGKVTLNILVGPDGKVAKAVATGGPTVFVESTLDAVKQWQYKASSSFTFAPAEVNFALSGIEI